MTDSTANPFAPPQAVVIDPAQAIVLPPARKPIAVWLMQGLGVVAILWVGGLALKSWVGQSLQGGVAGLAMFLLFGGLYVAYFVVLVVDCQKRRRRGRRMGLTLLGLILLFELLWLAGELVAGDLGRHWPHPIARLFSFAMPLLATGATLAWGWRFGFSRAARAWFGLDEADASAA